MPDQETTQVLQAKDGRPLVWVIRTEQDVGSEIVRIADSRGTARRVAERICSETLDDPVQLWAEDYADGNSELGLRESELGVIIARRYLDTSETAEVRCR